MQEQNVRTDGRKFLSFRPVSVNVSSIVQADSSAIFKLGDTTAVCGIKVVSIVTTLYMDAFHLYPFLLV